MVSFIIGLLIGIIATRIFSVDKIKVLEKEKLEQAERILDKDAIISALKGHVDKKTDKVPLGARSKKKRKPKR